MNLKYIATSLAKINVETPYLTNEGKSILMVIGGVAGTLTGGLDGMLYAFIVLMCIDYFTGVMLAIVTKDVKSQVGAKGIAKKCYMLIMVVVGNVVDVYSLGQGSLCRSAVITFYTANELFSIAENAGNLGLPVPKKLMDILAQIKAENKSVDKKEEDNTESEGE